MIRFKVSEPQFAPRYMTKWSSAADVYSTVNLEIPPQQCMAVPTGLWIESIDWDLVPNGLVPEIQIRSRSSLAFKNGIMLANGVGTIDADYPDEIKVLLWNSRTDSSFTIRTGDRVAQIVVNCVQRVTQFEVGGVRTGGFGSTGRG